MAHGIHTASYPRCGKHDVGNQSDPAVHTPANSFAASPTTVTTADDNETLDGSNVLRPTHACIQPGDPLPSDHAHTVKLLFATTNAFMHTKQHPPEHPIRALDTTFDAFPFKERQVMELNSLVISLLYAAGITMAKIMGAKNAGHEHSSAAHGYILCIASLQCGHLLFASAGVFGVIELSAYGVAAYISVPAALFLFPIEMFWKKAMPGMWPNFFSAPAALDWQIPRKVYALSPNTLGLCAILGGLSLACQITQFSSVLPPASNCQVEKLINDEPRPTSTAYQVEHIDEVPAPLAQAETSHIPADSPQHQTEQPEPSTKVETVHVPIAANHYRHHHVGQKVIDEVHNPYEKVEIAQGSKPTPLELITQQTDEPFAETTAQTSAAETAKPSLVSQRQVERINEAQKRPGPWADAYVFCNWGLTEPDGADCRIARDVDTNGNCPRPHRSEPSPSSACRTRSDSL